MAIPKLNNVYVGERYIPKYEGTWDETKDYEGLVIVNYNNSSYVSKKPVPAGTPVTNEDYWALMSNFGGKLTELENKVTDIENQIESGEIAGGTWINAKTLGIVPGVDIGPILSSLPSDVPNIAFPAGEYTVDTACTINVPTLFAPGAYLKTSKVVTFGKEITAGREWVFRKNGDSGKVRYIPTGATVYPEWWGWFPQGRSGGSTTGADDLNAANLVQPTISLGAGSYAGGTYTWNQKNLTIKGLGRHNSSLSMNNSSFATTNYLTIKDIFIDSIIIIHGEVVITDCFIGNNVTCVNNTNLYMNNVHEQNIFAIVVESGYFNFTADNIISTRPRFIIFNPLNMEYNVLINNSKIGSENDAGYIIYAPNMQTIFITNSKLEINNSTIYCSMPISHGSNNVNSIHSYINNSEVELYNSVTSIDHPNISFTGCKVHNRASNTAGYFALYTNCNLSSNYTSTSKKHYEGLFVNCVLDGTDMLNPIKPKTAYINCDFLNYTGSFTGAPCTVINSPLGKNLKIPPNVAE